MAIRYEDLENKESGFNLIKPFIKESTSIDSSLFFYISSAIYKSETIKNLLNEHWVICDRYIYSTLAYHKVRGADISCLQLDLMPIIQADFLFLIKTKEEIRISRLNKRKKSNKADFQPNSSNNSVGKMELELEKFASIVIDNSDNDIQKTVKRIVEKYILQ